MGHLRLWFSLRGVQLLRRHLKNNSLTSASAGNRKPAFLDKIFKVIEADPHTQLEVNLPTQTISSGNRRQRIVRHQQLQKEQHDNGYDDIDYLQAMKTDIKSFAEKSLY